MAVSLLVQTFLSAELQNLFDTSSELQSSQGNIRAANAVLGWPKNAQDEALPSGWNGSAHRRAWRPLIFDAGRVFAILADAMVINKES